MNRDLVASAAGDDDFNKIMAQTMLNINAVSEQMGIVVTQVKAIRADQMETNNRLTDLENRFNHHEETDRVTRDQARRIRAAIHARVNYVLGIEFQGGLVKKECLSIDKKYRGAFLGRCYSDARKYSSLGSPYSETCQKDYKAVIDYVENWEPECEYNGKTGTRAYIAYLDDREDT